MSPTIINEKLKQAPDLGIEAVLLPVGAPTPERTLGALARGGWDLANKALMILWGLDIATPAGGPLVILEPLEDIKL